MEYWLTSLITIFCSVAASSGFWAYMSRRTEKKDANSKMILGLGHDRLLFLCMSYMNRGSITSDELENLHTYLYEPYVDLGGNGTVTRIMKRVDALPITLAKNEEEK